MTMFAHRYHDFSYGHRVFGHESSCKHLHGHNGRVTFHCSSDSLDNVGRVIDFSVIKSTLCAWLESNWDHKFLVFKDDPFAPIIQNLDPNGVVVVDFNPTAENMAKYLVNTVGPLVLKNSGVELVRVDFMETIKCGSTYVKSSK